MSVMLSEAVGARRARQMSFTALPIDAKTALSWGLVNLIVPHEALLSTAREIGRAIGVNAIDAVQGHVGLYDNQSRLRNAEALRLETAAWLGVESIKRVQPENPGQL